MLRRYAAALILQGKEPERKLTLCGIKIGSFAIHELTLSFVILAGLMGIAWGDAAEAVSRFTSSRTKCLNQKERLSPLRPPR